MSITITKNWFMKAACLLAVMLYLNSNEAKAQATYKINASVQLQVVDTVDVWGPWQHVVIAEKHPVDIAAKIVKRHGFECRYHVEVKNLDDKDLYVVGAILTDNGAGGYLVPGQRGRVTYRLKPGESKTYELVKDAVVMKGIRGVAVCKFCNPVFALLDAGTPLGLGVDHNGY